MRKVFSPVLFIIFFALLLMLSLDPFSPQQSGAPPYDGSNSDYVSESEEEALIRNWKRPEGPARVALQIGHLKNDAVPEELKNLRGNTGATGGGKSEAEVNAAIAEETAILLRKQGITVEILPATVPQHYWADVFVAIHADGSEDTFKTGFKVTSPRRSISGNSAELAGVIEKTYGEVTQIELDPNVTTNMRGYYAFSWWRYEHTVHPMTAAAILETGFLTNPADRLVIVNRPDVSGEGLAKGIVTYLKQQKLLAS